MVSPFVFQCVASRLHLRLRIWGMAVKDDEHPSFWTLVLLDGCCIACETFRMETYEEALVEALQFTAGFLIASLRRYTSRR
jgi:hypothetical protein